MIKSFKCVSINPIPYSPFQLKQFFSLSKLEGHDILLPIYFPKKILGTPSFEAKYSEFSNHVVLFPFLPVVQITGFDILYLYWGSFKEDSLEAK